MGANVYLESVAAFGDSGEGGSSVIIKNIPGRPGERIAVRAYNLYGGSTAVDFYFMQVLGTASLEAAMAAGGSILNLDAQPTTVQDIAAGDYVCIVQNNGVYHFTEVGASVTGYSVIVLCTVIVGAAAIGQGMYFFGIYSDAGHFAITMTATTESAKELDGGIFYAAAKGYPMMLFNLQAVTTAAQMRYLTVDYINK